MFIQTYNLCFLCSFTFSVLLRSAGKEFEEEDMHPSPLKFDINGYWSDVIKRQFTFSKESSSYRKQGTAVQIRVHLV